MVSSLTMYDFILAAMIICLDIDAEIGHDRPAQVSGNTTAIERREELSRVLEKSYDIWKESSGSSKEAAKASGALRIMLQKSRAASSGSQSSQDRLRRGEIMFDATNDVSASFEGYGLQKTADQTASLPQGPDPNRMAVTPDVLSLDFTTLENWIDAPADLDWVSQ
jgi:hypothetical protein